MNSNPSRSAESRILTVNTGSSSVKIALFNVAKDGIDPTPLSSATLKTDYSDHDGIAEGHIALTVLRRDNQVAENVKFVESGSMVKRSLFQTTIERLSFYSLPPTEPQSEIKLVAHRIVHGGDAITGPVELTSQRREELAKLNQFAPLHQPHNLAGVDIVEKILTNSKQIGCFDTAFHRGRSNIADSYALPKELFELGIRKYGYHGLSVESVLAQLKLQDPKLANGRVIVAHLGSGASLCGLAHGKSIESTMGFSTLDGLTMGTRCGQIDPGVILYLGQQRKLSFDQISELLYRESGLLGLSGISADMQLLIKHSSQSARDAVEHFVCSVIRGIGQLCAQLNGVDCLVFTGGIGENCAQIRETIISRLGWLDRQSARPVTYLTLPAREDLVMAQQALNFL